MSRAARFTAPVILPCDPACSVVRDGVLDIDEDGRIGYVGPATTAPPSDAPVLAHPGILLPGLVNAHAHSPMTLFRGWGGDLPLLRWLHEIIWPAEARLRPADVRAGMLLGCVEMLRAGVTTSAEMYFHADEVISAVLTTGFRVVIAAPLIDLPGQDWRLALREIDKRIDTEGLRFGPANRIELAYGAHSAYMLPPEALTAIAMSARERDALLHIHVAEAADEDAAQREKYGSVPKMLASLDVLGGRVLAAHAIHLSDEDIAVLATHGVGVAHCPGSNAKLASGIARLTALRAAGVPVGLGTDGPASNDDLDLWEEIRLAALLARVSTMDAMALTAKDALLMATRDGATALGRTDIGTLEPGRWADIIALHPDNLALSGGLTVPDEELLANLVWGAGATAVHDVWVAGEQVLAAGEPTRVDRLAVQTGVRAASNYLRG